MPITIAASDAKARFSELLNRVARGESFSITLHGLETAKLVPAKKPGLEDIHLVVAELKAGRTVLNPPGKKRLKLKDLIDEGRP